MSCFLKKSELTGLVESFLLDKMSKSSYPVSQCESIRLATWNRLDVAFKILYLEFYKKNAVFAESIYFNDIRSQSLGCFVEPGNSAKAGFEVYVDTFIGIHRDIEAEGFDDAASIIPLACDGSILNGAHRTSAAIHHKKSVTVVETELSPLVCDYEYFFERSVPNEITELAVRKLIECGDGFYLSFLWPSGKNNWDEAVKLFSGVAYRKRINLTLNGALNLLYECYSHMDWVGDYNNKFRGLYQKVTECFPDSFEVEVVVFQERLGIDAVRELKGQVRRINGIGFSSIHITDTKEETLRISSYLLNENGLHYLNHSSPFNSETRSKLNDIRNCLISSGVDFLDVAVDGSFILELYGLRVSQDVDYLFSDSVDRSTVSGLDSRDEQLVYHGVDKADLIYDPKYHFYVNGVKCVSLRQIMKMKKNRGESKDRIDVKMIATLHHDLKIYKLYLSLKQRLLYVRLRARRGLRNWFMFALRALGLYTVVRHLYRKMKGRAA